MASQSKKTKRLPISSAEEVELAIENLERDHDHGGSEFEDESDDYDDIRHEFLESKTVDLNRSAVLFSDDHKGGFLPDDLRWLFMYMRRFKRAIALDWLVPFMILCPYDRLLKQQLIRNGLKEGWTVNRTVQLLMRPESTHRASTLPQFRYELLQQLENISILIQQYSDKDKENPKTELCYARLSGSIPRDFASLVQSAENLNESVQIALDDL